VDLPGLRAVASFDLGELSRDFDVIEPTSTTNDRWVCVFAPMPPCSDRMAAQWEYRHQEVKSNQFSRFSQERANNHTLGAQVPDSSGAFYTT
jgi:hypothetical protein